MKKIFIILFVLLSRQFAFSQEIIHEIKNNIHNYYPKYGCVLKFDDKILLSLENLLDKGISEYYIHTMVYYDDRGNYIFPCNGKLLIEASDGSIIELTSVMSIKREDYSPEAYYPITIEQLETLFKGVRNIKIDLLTYNKSKKNVVKSSPNMKSNPKKFVEFLRNSYYAIEKEKMK